MDRVKRILNPFSHDSRHSRQDIENIFSFLRFIILGIYLPWVYSGVFSCLFWSVLCGFFSMLRTHPFVPIACLGSQDECFSCIFNEAEVNMGMFV